MIIPPVDIFFVQVDCDKADARFRESSGHESCLSPTVAAVTVSECGGFTREIEQFSSACACDQIKSLMLHLIHGSS